METFTVDPCGWQIFRIVGRNPLLRRCDRVEALVALVAVVVVLVGIPVAGLAGVVVYTARDRQYAQEALTRHVLTQTAVNTDSTARDAGTAAAPEPAPSTAGRHIEIWVDSSGNPVPPPTPGYHAAIDGTATTVAIVLGSAIGMSSLLGMTRWRVDRARDAQWERELRCLQNDSGRNSQQ